MYSHLKSSILLSPIPFEKSKKKKNKQVLPHTTITTTSSVSLSRVHFCCFKSAHKKISVEFPIQVCRFIHKFFVSTQLSFFKQQQSAIDVLWCSFLFARHIQRNAYKERTNNDEHQIYGDVFLFSLLFLFFLIFSLFFFVRSFF